LRLFGAELPTDNAGNSTDRRAVVKARCLAASPSSTAKTARRTASSIRSTIFRIFDIGGTLLVAPLSLQPARWICYSAPNICSSLPAGLRADHASRQDGKWCNDLPRPRRRARLSLAAFLAVGGAGLLPARVTLSARRGARAVGGLARADRTTPTAGRAVLIRRLARQPILVPPGVHAVLHARVNASVPLN